MKKYSFVKMNGAGNDFIVFNKDEVAGLQFSSSLIKKLCDRRFGIGADGVITVAKSEAHDFEMEYFNADGTTGTLCGNGARCAIQFADTFNVSKSKSVKFLSDGIDFSGSVLENGLVRFNLNDPNSIKENFSLKVSASEVNANFINTGSPHVVFFLDDPTLKESNLHGQFTSIDDFPVFTVGKEVRYSKAFAPAGTNVNFLEIKDSVIHIRTYERGVEDETLACGTGSVASAIITFLQKQIPPPLTLVTRGGEKLIVDFSAEGKLIKNVSLTGPAKINFSGEVTL
ncbi:MAG: diaminopimelate epimerase [Ignavibacteria bacterium]|nr:diaminopimelate epimerase [Ignavibacteria bacterium]